MQDGATFCTACGAQMAPGPGGQWGAPPPPPVPAHYPPPQQYQPAQPVPSSKGDEQGGLLRVIVIILVVIVVLVAVGGALFLMGIQDFIDNQAEEPLVTFSRPVVGPREISNVTVWDATLRVAQVTPQDRDVYWDDLTITIKDREGFVLQSEAIAGLDGSAPYDDAANGWVDVEFWYGESPVDSALDPGEAIIITGMDLQYQGSSVIVLLGDAVIGTVSLPLIFQ